MTAGYSGTPLPRKLGVKDDHVVFLDRVPADVDLGDLGGAHVVRRLPAEAGRDPHLPHDDGHARSRGCRPCSRGPRPPASVWVCWPKKAAHKALLARGIDCDLDENLVRDLGLELGFVDVKVAAVDADLVGAEVRPPPRGPLARRATPAGWARHDRLLGRGRRGRGPR